jgi:hypothetical protein
VWPAEVEDVDALLRHADAAMYDVKRGRQSASGTSPSRGKPR